MFNVLIVDDNEIVLECLTKFVNWADLGYRVVGVAVSVDDAMKIVENEYVDVILSDIVMPRKNGFELIKSALQINPIIKTVILSSFGEFNYAQDAIRLGAYDYLVKPVNFDDLNRIFTELKEILEKEIVEEQRKGDYKSIMYAQIINNLVNGFFYNIETINEKAMSIGLETNDKDLCIIRVLINSDSEMIYNVSGKDYEKVLKNIGEKAKGYLSNYGKVYTFNHSLFELGILFYPNALEDMRKVLGKYAEIINNSEHETIYLGVGSVYQNIVEISKSFNEAGKALECRHICKENNIFYFEELSVDLISSDIQPNIKDKQMGIVMDNVLRYIDEHYNEKITLKMLSNIAYVHPIYLSTMFKSKSGENFVEYLTKVRIEHAKTFLNDLSYRIYDVCQMVGYESPKHFSKVFKECTGITPKEYRNNI
jgi:YesN/AraC family two-component response regulator